MLTDARPARFGSAAANERVRFLICASRGIERGARNDFFLVSAEIEGIFGKRIVSRLGICLRNKIFENVK